MAHPVSVLLNVSDMIDLAIGTPEIGVVDFCMLHTVLHCLAQQLGVLNKPVELKGSIATLHTPGRDRLNTVEVTEYVIDTESEKPSGEKSLKKADQVVSTQPPMPSPDTVLVVEKRKKGGDAVSGINEPESGVQGVSSTEKLTLVTLSKFNILEKAVQGLKDRVYGKMPSNEDILNEVRSQTNVNAISDVWTSLNVTSRLEAAEEGINKLSSLMQDLITDTPGVKEAIQALKKRDTQPASGTESEEEGGGTKPGEVGEEAQKKDLLEMIKSKIEHIHGDLEDVTNKFNSVVGDMEIDVGQISLAGAGAPKGPRESDVRREDLTLQLIDRISELENRVRQCCEEITKKEADMGNELTSLQDQIEYLSKQLTAITDSGCVPGQILSGEIPKDMEGLMALFQTVQNMQEQFKLVRETALQLAAEKEDRQAHMDALIEQIEALKIIKLDREDMEEAMAEKADLRQLARKVSHDQFEHACDDLSQGLAQTLGKLDIQEALWQQALDDIQREIETKLDRMELSPVKDFFNNKLKQLQENLKKLASLRTQAQAAGTKKQLLKDVNCISCDANAVMPMEAASTVPVLQSLQPSFSMKPYLCYELDVIRKAQATNMPQRNMHDWENIEKQAPQKKRPRSENDKHLCNRYCGGSHTVTTPAQRVARIGHFVKQWGPDVIPLSSGLAAGDDGRLYKVSTSEGAAVGPDAADRICTPKSKKNEGERSKTVPQECRCLDGDGAQK